MSTAGQAIGGALGAVGGFMLGGFTGAMYGAQLGLMAGGYLDPPKGPTVDGPRLDDLTVQTSTYGAVIPRVYGTVAVTGNVFWLENNALKETATRTTQSSGGGGKGGGSKTTTTAYSYSAAFAVGLCDCPAAPIVGIRRIWIAGRLWYDAGSTDFETLVASNAASEYFTLHTGGEDQAPDERMQATLGVANTPAYRGLAYIVFRDLPLAEYSNSLMGAQVKVEVVSTGATAGYLKLGRYTDENPYANASIRSCAFAVRDVFVYYVQPKNDSRLYPGIADIKKINLITGGISVVATNVSVAGAVWGPGYGKNHDGTLIFGTHDYHPGVWVNGAVVEDTALSSAGYYYSIRDGKYYTARYAGECLEYLIGSISAGPLRTYVTPFAHSFGWLCETTPDYVYFGVYNSDTARYVIAKFDRETGDYVASADVGTINGASVVADDEIYYVVTTGVNTLYVTRDFFATSTQIAANTDFAIGSLGNYPFVVLDVASDVLALWTERYTTGICAVLKLSPTLTSTTPTLASIVAAEVAQSRLLTAADIDVSGLTQSVRGYRLASVGTLRAGIEPLRGAFPFDVVQHGYLIIFKPRAGLGGASVVTIPAADLDARAAGNAPGVSITCVREMDSQLPRRVRVSFMDADREYDVNEQSDERQNTASVNVTSLDLAVVLTCGEAAGIAQVLLYLYWLERCDVTFTLPPTYSALEPGDVVTINADEATYVLRLTAITYAADGRLECRAKYHRAATYTPTAVAVAGPVSAQTLFLVGDTNLAVLDIPLLVDSSDRPGFVAALGGYRSGWPGGLLYRSVDAGQTWTLLQAVAAPGAIIGSATTVIGAGRTDLIDSTSVLGVIMASGELSSVSEAALLNGANHFAYGAPGRWEIIAAKNCTLQSDGSYVLTDLLRGRQGTEWACATHVDNDTLVFLDADAVKFVTVSLDSIGSLITCRGVTAGQDLAAVFDTAFTYTGVNLECLAPVYLNGNRHPTTQDWTLTWTRRTRVGGQWRSFVDATLGEASEAYEIDIYSSAAYTTVKRTLTATTASVIYTSAQQITDFALNQATLYVKVYQLSASVGRGYPLTASITR